MSSALAGAAPFILGFRTIASSSALVAWAVAPMWASPVAYFMSFARRISRRVPFVEIHVVYILERFLVLCYASPPQGPLIPDGR